MMIRYALPGTILLLILMLVSVLPIRDASARPPEQSQIRLGIGHSGVMLATADDLPPDIAAKIPANVDPATLLGGERFPVNVRLVINGEPVVERSYRPRGLRKEGSSEGLEVYWLPPGVSEIDVEMMDDGATWRQTFAESVEILPGESLVLYYDEESDQFVAR